MLILHISLLGYVFTEELRFFSSISLSKDHQTLHSGLKLEECEIHQETVPQPHVQQQNIFSITQKPYECQFCDKKFRQIHSKNDHETTVHLKQKPFKCRFCAQTFGLRCNRKTHEKTVHFKQKPHECRYCNKTFARVGTRNTHEMTVHLKQRPYKCRFCDKTFGQVGSRNLHERAVHGESSSRAGPEQ